MPSATRLILTALMPCALPSNSESKESALSWLCGRNTDIRRPFRPPGCSCEWSSAWPASCPDWSCAGSGWSCPEWSCPEWSWSEWSWSNVVVVVVAVPGMVLWCTVSGLLVVGPMSRTVRHGRPPVALRRLVRLCGRPASTAVTPARW